MNTRAPGGLGPWFCTLFFNASQSKKCKKQTYISACSMPHLTLDSLNSAHATTNSDSRKRARDEGECWVMILKVGPFRRWDDAVKFMGAWTTQTRGKIRRIDRGLELFYGYRVQHNLQAWAQECNRDTCVESFFNGVRDPIHETYDDVSDFQGGGSGVFILSADSDASLSAFDAVGSIRDIYEHSLGADLHNIRQVHDKLAPVVVKTPVSSKKIKTAITD